MSELTVMGDSWGGQAPKALVIAADRRRGQESGKALALAGCDPRGPVDFSAALADPEIFGGAKLVVIDTLAAPEDALDIILARADMAARNASHEVVAVVAPEQIDAVAAQLFGPRSQILCDPEPPELLGAMSYARWRNGARVQDVASDAEAARLQRLNEEVARIADTLVRLTRQETASVRTPEHSYRGPDGAEIEANAQEIRAVIRSRRMRAQYFAETLFGDPAWDMLLDLFAADLERRRVSVSSLCIAAAVPPTTALRWIGTMHDAGLFERQADPNDRRRAYIVLSAKGRAGMRGFVSAVKRAGLPLV